MIRNEKKTAETLGEIVLEKIYAYKEKQKGKIEEEIEKGRSK